ncbi:2-amino-4-hydroxy-6-hydroxymethyldihydropteridine diphosphokinase [Maribacter stanieri]|jgi:2-amino-4-hydroxy-6-hydroxymethyldihydropteridine diphosphokinase|uniref:2-amino-4-hydroxy-6-hydroxymethyldihydropteridine pyrophosphokinase n=1 Tax=Maribacter stanieri TaxID=440514 RepID=A0A1I6IAL1_9FLAO|nr:2-amino-4-hydroxy-6-hydroxymethyldihydropteridine diphosphokinase [Maribacter stanieri]SFR63699.1 2-amino-4-hydroxy-6-hydroxymethyldihydropteridinediphosphokinase [Maribacter stanieri]|tara:strand:- start:3845 stop:4987 length:1143 start_codon:yes stop_codon:yes gene_type:complete
MGVYKTAFLSIGSNLGDRLLLLQKAIFEIGKVAGEIRQVSAIYETPSWGFEGEDFFNACLELQTLLSPEDLLSQLLTIETNFGRERKDGDGYQSRTLDIDIIYYEKEIIDTENLTVPHPKMQERKFILKPLADITPQFYHPIFNKDTRNLLQECKDKSTITKQIRRLFKNRHNFFASLEYLAIEGNIGAGKTTLATKISEDFNAKLILERFAENPFLPNFYKDQDRYAFPLEMSFLADRYQQFTEDTNQLDLFKSFMVSDYDIYKSLIFAKITLQQNEFDLYRKVFNFMYKEVKKPKVYVYLYQTTERLLQQIKQRGRDYEQNIELSYLEKINRGYFDFLRTYPKENQLIIDVSELDFVSHERDYETILATIEDFALSNL